MKIYIASRWSQRSYLQGIRQQLNEIQHQVVSSWLDEIDANDFNKDSAFHRRLAIRDLVEISSSDLLILDETTPLSAGSGGGREVEFGFALGQFQFTKVWVVGEPHNPFHYLADRIFTNWDEAIKELSDGK